jgi:uncharacterized membrane protein
MAVRLAAMSQIVPIITKGHDMLNTTENKLNRRGGIPLRDTTRGSYSPIEEDEKKGLQKINFSKAGQALGWVSLGLGLAELILPKRIQRMAGVSGHHSDLIQLLGIRELAHAAVIFLQARPYQGLWSRVFGDAIDLAFLGAALASPKTKKTRASVVAASVLGLAALDLFSLSRISQVRNQAKGYSTLTQADLNGGSRGREFHVTKNITVNRSPEMLYAFWRNFENLPQIMLHLEAVRVIDSRRSHWVAKAPAGKHVEWDAEITDDRPNELIAWHSIPNADVPNYGFIRFEPSKTGRGTVVHVEIEYRPPAGAIGRIFAKLFGEEPSQQVEGDLRRFKQVMETGEVLLSEGSPQGYGQRLQRPG